MVEMSGAIPNANDPERVAHNFVTGWEVFFKTIGALLVERLLQYSKYSQDEKFSEDITSAVNLLNQSEFTTWLDSRIQVYLRRGAHRSEEAIWLTNEMNMIADRYSQLDKESTSSDNGTFEQIAKDAEIVKGSIEGFVTKIVGGIVNGFIRIVSKQARKNEERGKAATKYLNEAIKILA